MFLKSLSKNSAETLKILFSHDIIREEKFGSVNVIVKRALSADAGKGNISCLCIVCLYGTY